MTPQMWEPHGGKSREEGVQKNKKKYTGFEISDTAMIAVTTVKKVRPELFRILQLLRKVAMKKWLETLLSNCTRKKMIYFVRYTINVKMYY